MQAVTLIAHVIGCIVALLIHARHSEWKYYAVMLLLFNAVGVLFYLSVFFELPIRHELSQIRSFLQALILVMFSIGLMGTLNGRSK